jgi:hypothetical protein
MPTSVIEETQLTPAPSPADSPSAQPPSAATGSIGVGASVIVQTDGAALLGRVNPGRSSEIAVRFPNGAQLTVLDGPQEADGLIWWQVEGEAGSGWSAGNFLQLADE